MTILPIQTVLGQCLPFLLILPRSVHKLKSNNLIVNLWVMIVSLFLPRDLSNKVLDVQDWAGMLGLRLHLRWQCWVGLRHCLHQQQHWAVRGHLPLWHQRWVGRRHLPVGTNIEQGSCIILVGTNVGQGSGIFLVSTNVEQGGGIFLGNIKRHTLSTSDSGRLCLGQPGEDGYSWCCLCLSYHWKSANGRSTSTGIC